MSWNDRLFSGVLATCVLAAAGGAARAEDFEPPPRAVPLPGPLSSAADDPYIGVGLSIGPVWPTDPTLDMGFYAVGHLAVRLGPWVALELDAGHTSFDDDYYGGDLTVNPVAGYVVVSFPLGPAYGSADVVNLRLAAGGGRLSNDHTFTEVEDEGFFALQTGIEWIIPGRARVFAVVDTMWADFVLGDRPIFDPRLGGPAIPFWDLEALTALRIGVEFAF